MKIGLILECQRGGPDQQIYEHLVKELYPNAHIETYPQTNKRLLMEQASLVCTEALSVDNCDFVFIIWDLSPAHPDIKARLCMKLEKDQLLHELHTKGVDSTKVKLVCVEYELESFLIADGRGLTQLVQSTTTHPIRAFPDCKTKAMQKGPKNTIWKYYPRYNDFTDAIKILRNFNGDYGRMRRKNPCFNRFMTALEGLN